MRPRAVAARLTSESRRLQALALVVGCTFAGAATLGPQPATAQEQEEEAPALLLIMDASGSMNASDGGGGTKIQAAKSALNGVVDALPEDSLVGLRVYGHRIPNTDKARGCKDTELIAPVGPSAAP